MQGGIAVRRILGFTSTCFLAMGALLFSGGALYGGYWVFQGHRLTSAGIGQVLQAESPDPLANLLVETGDPAVGIRIPSIDVDARVVEVGTLVNKQGALVWETPKDAVGHHQGTANPGETGNVILSGHISSPIRREGNVFSRLPELELGALIFLDTSKGTFSYQIVSQRMVEPTQVEVMDPTPERMVTLITCYPDWIYSHRLVLGGRLVGFEPSTG